MNASSKTSIGFSLLLHALVGGLVVFGLPEFTRPRPKPPAPIAVDFVRIADVTRVQSAAAETEKPEAETASSQPVIARSEVLEDTSDDVAPLPKPAPKAPPKTPTAVPKPKPKVDPKVDARRKLVARARPRPKPKAPSRFKSKVISSVIDRSIKEESERRPIREEETRSADKKTSEDPFAGLRGRFATATLVDALSQKLKGCWRFPVGAKNIETMQVTVRIHLRPDGALAREPQYVNAGDLSDGFYRVFAESALRAVRSCAPFDEAETLYQQGQSSVDFTFYGSEFSGG